MEYSMISMFVYFEDTLVNMVLLEACLEWYSNGVTKIENKYVKCESNRREKQLSLIKSKNNWVYSNKKTIEYNQIKHRESNWVKNGD